MYKTLFSFFLMFQISIVTLGQKHTISGYVKDAESGEELIGATVRVNELGTGTVTNIYGFYSITLPEGEYNLSYSYLGYQTAPLTIQLNENIKSDMELSPSAASLKEVVITGEREDENIRSAEMGTVKMDVKDLETIPVLFGEKDILKTIQLLPGVSTSGEGSSGFYVRGGNTDQNLILLDEAPVYNASHLLGFFSVFNSDALKDIKLYKAGIPSQFGGRLSSVLDVHMNNGNSKKLAVSGGIGLISSRLTVESPIVKDKGSIIISGRRTYADVLYGLIDPEFSDSDLFFYDFNAKANYKLGEKNRVFLSGYFGRDKLGFGGFGFNWGNATGTLRWNHIFNDNLFSNTSLIYSNYDYQINIDFAGTKIELGSGIQDYNLKQDFSYYANTNNTIKFGFSSVYHSFSPGDRLIELESGEQIPGTALEQQQALESGIYLSNEQKLGSRLNLNYGLRYSLFNVLGPTNVYSYDDDGSPIDTTAFDQGELIENYGGLEPRFSLSYSLNERSSLKASYHKMRQYIHLLSNSTADNPTDIWLPSSSIVKPEIADQYSIGYFRNFMDNTFEGSIEVYYKDAQNQIDYKNGADVLFNDQVESDLVFGKGRSYGAEFFIKKRVGNFTGWIGYTLSKSERQFDDINNGEWFSARQDRTHDVSIVGSYNLTKRLTVGATWVYYTGDAITFPSGKYTINGDVVPLYTERNGYRMPDYHRLDLSLTLKGKERERFNSSWNFSIYNAYARQNAYSISFQESETNPGTTEAVQLSLFSIVPAITWNFNF